MRTRIEIIKVSNDNDEYQKIFGRDVADIISKTKAWGIQNQLFSFDGFEKAIEDLNVESYELKHSRIGPIVNSTTFGANIKKLVRTCHFNYTQSIGNNNFSINDFKNMMKTSLVLPIRVIIDWLLDDSKKIRYIDQTNCFVTIDKDGQMFDDFELLCLDEAEQKGCDVDYQISDIDNYRINPRTSKEQYRVERAPINGEKFRKTWANASVVDAPALTN